MLRETGSGVLALVSRGFIALVVADNHRALAVIPARGFSRPQGFIALPVAYVLHDDSLGSGHLDGGGACAGGKQRADN